MTDGRTLVGLFLCTDRDCNVILGSAQEFLKSTGTQCTPGTHLMLYQNLIIIINDGEMKICEVMRLSPQS